MQTVLTRLTWKEQIADERLKLSYVFIHLAHPGVPQYTEYRPVLLNTVQNNESIAATDGDSLVVAQFAGRLNDTCRVSA